MKLETLINPIEIVQETNNVYRVVHPRVIFNTKKDISELTSKKNLTEDEVLQIQRIYKFSIINIPKEHAEAKDFKIIKISRIYARRLCVLTEESVEMAHNNYEYACQFFTQTYNKAKHYKLKVNKSRHLTYIYKLVKAREKR
mgnify:CR=1 FL=1